jgi:uncharacterized flavoprotein (TIGR03862 family)
MGLRTVATSAYLDRSISPRARGRDGALVGINQVCDGRDFGAAETPRLDGATARRRGADGGRDPPDAAVTAGPGAPAALVVGGGPAGLMAAERLAAAGAAVTVIDAMPSLGRKLLMAGRGGLNLTHAEPPERFLDRYGAARAALEPAIRAFGPAALRDWCAGLGVETFVGSSGRVFPTAMKASPLLRAWLARLAAAGVALRPRTRWVGWRDGGAAVEGPDGAATLRPDATVLACGGASWPRLGSDGAWAGPVGAVVPVAPFAPANCGLRVAWSAPFAARFPGAPVKGAAFAHAGRSVRGEAVVTAAGLEGGAIYALSAAVRDALAADGAAVLTADLKPDVSEATLAARLSSMKPGLSLANRLRRLGLSPVAAGLVREAGTPPADPAALAARIRAVALRVEGTAGLDRAISSAGGLRLSALDDRFMLRDRPGVFACGEMLDWEAPTGGYLLTACLATGRAAGEGAAAWLGRRPLAQDGAAALYAHGPRLGV